MHSVLLARCEYTGHTCEKIQRMHSVLLAHETNGPRMHSAFNAQPVNGSGHVTVRLVLHAVTCSAATSAQLQDATKEKVPEVPEPQEKDRGRGKELPSLDPAAVDEDASKLTTIAQRVASALRVYRACTTNTQRVLRLCLAVVQRAVRVSGVLLASTFMRQALRTFLCMHKNPDAQSESQRLYSVGPACSTNE